MKYISTNDIESYVENNPIFTLRDFGERALINEDWVSLTIIFESFTSKLLKLLDINIEKRSENEVKNRDIINSFIILADKITYKAINSNNRETINTLFNCIYNIHDYCANKKIPSQEMTELNNFINSSLLQMLETKLDASIEEGLNILELIIIKQYEKNTPNESDISSFNKTIKRNPETYKVNSHWRYISFEYIRIINNIGNEAIKLRKN